MNNCKGEKLERLLQNRGYIDYLLMEQEGEFGDSKELRANIKEIVNICILNAIEYIGAEQEEIEKLSNML